MKPRQRKQAAKKRSATPKPKPGARKRKAKPGAKPAPKPAAKKRAPAPRIAVPKMVGMIDVKWPGVRNAPEGKLKRFYQMDSLIHGTQGLLARKDCWLLLGIQDKLGPDDVTALTFRFQREDKRSLIFRLDAVNSAGKKARLQYIVSRNHEEHANALERRFDSLELAAQRAPSRTLELLAIGPVFLPDRPGRRKEKRPLLASVTTMPQGLPAEWRRNGQIAILDERPVTLTKADTDRVREEVAELVLRCYDPVQRTGVAPPMLNTGDLLIHRAKRSPAQSAYTGGDTLRGRPNPVRLIARLFEDRGGGIWLPEDPEGLFRAAKSAVGEARARAWLGDYVKQARGRSVTSPGDAYIDALHEYVVE